MPGTVLSASKVAKPESSHAASRERVSELQRQPKGFAPETFLQGSSFCPCGGGCPRCTGTFQAKLKVGPPGDKYEQEADRIADQVMRMPEPGVQRKCAGPECDEEKIQAKPISETITPLIQRMETPEEEEEHETPLQKKGEGMAAGAVSSGLQQRIDSLRGGGRPLDPAARAFFEPRFGADFSQVRVHSDIHASGTAQQINAQAFTKGHDIVFASGYYAPGKEQGLRLLAHELTHVVQQNKQSQHSYLQRACGSKAIGPTPVECMLVSKIPIGERFLFKANCDEFASGEEGRLVRYAKSISPSISVSILGMASLDGKREFNESLSCKRAERARFILTTIAGIPSSNVTSVEATGPMGTPNDKSMRAVDISLGRSSPTKKEQPPRIGPVQPTKCLLPYDPLYAPNRSNCAIYQNSLAKRFLTWTYRNNATCACENTPNDPKNNCIRKCLQVKMTSSLVSKSRSGAVIGTCIDPFGILDFACPEPYCSELYDHHVRCYKECCCDNDFIGYPAFWFMCEAPYPCSFVTFSIRKFNSCDK